jgi:putative spermidine/putrescine transport system permease protein
VAASRHNRTMCVVGLVVPGGFLLIGFVLPILYLLVVSFRTAEPGQLFGAGFTVANYATVLADNFYQSIILRTVLASLAVTTSCLLVGYPLALVLLRLPARWRAAALVLLVFPLMMSNVIRAYGWIAIMGRRGVLNSTLQGVGIIDHPLSLLYTFQSVVLTLMTILLPYTVVSIYNTLSALDRRYVEASQSLGAGPIRTFLQVIWPLSAPGVAAGLSIVWLLVLSAYVTISLIGGARLKLLVSFVYDSAMAFQWPRAAALAFVLLSIGLLGTAALFAMLRPDRIRGPR